MVEEIVKLFAGSQVADRKVYEGWKRVEITRNLTSIVGSFSLSLFDRWRQDKTSWPLKTGSPVRIEIGGETILNGYIDSLEAAFDAEHRSITVSGRDKAGDLVDSSVTAEPGEFYGLTLDKLTSELSAPFNINVKNVTDVGPSFDPWTVKQGETVFESLERAARLRGVLFISDAYGNLVITRRGEKRSATELVQGVNVISGAATYDDSNRFSDYIVKGQMAGRDNFHGEQVTSPLGNARDKGVVRYRPQILIAEGSIDQEAAVRRAKWEAIVRSAQASKVSIKVRGWRGIDGKLWEINTQVKVRCRFLGIERDMLISGVTFVQDEIGTTTDLELIRPDSFEPASIVNQQDDPIATLGWGAA